MHLSGVTAPSMKRRNTSLGTRTTPSYLPIPTPNSMAWLSAFQRASSGKGEEHGGSPIDWSSDVPILFPRARDGKSMMAQPGFRRRRGGSIHVWPSGPEDAVERDPGA